MAVDWSYMPDEILELIAARVTTIADLLAFSVVCRSWYSAYKHVKPGWTAKTPWLMLGEDRLGDPDYRCRKFYDPSTNKLYQMEIPEIFVGWGSPYGWIVAIDFNLDIFMFNPLTGAKANLPSAYTLPPGESLARLYKRDDPPSIKRQRRVRANITKVILFKTPRKDHNKEAEDDQFLAVSLSDNGIYICVARPNQPRWIPVLVGNEIPDGRRVAARDVAYSNEYDTLFIIFHDGSISIAKDMHDKLDVTIGEESFIRASDFSRPVPGIEFNKYSDLDSWYLMESFGDLLVILRVRADTPATIDDDCSYRTQAFYVFKLNYKTKEWEYVIHLGNKSLLVGGNTTMAIQVCESVDCRPNCIYFTDDCWLGWYFVKGGGGHDMGIFCIDENLNKNRCETLIKSLYEGEGMRALYSGPVLFVPKF